MRSINYINGKWVNNEDLKISAFDLSVIRGFGIFDFLRTYNKKPFRIDDHIDRLFSSAKILSITVPKTREEIKEIVANGLQKNSYPEATIKLLLTGGISKDGITPGEPSFIVMFTGLPSYPEINYTKGVKIISYPYLRFLPEVKSFNYFPAVYAMQKATKEKAVEVLYIDQKHIIRECTRSNIFFIKGGKLITPKEDLILKGVTRKIVIEVAKKNRIQIIERDIKENEISSFDECFITGSTIEVLPTVLIDKIKIGNGKVGSVTGRIMRLFNDATSPS